MSDVVDRMKYHQCAACRDLKPGGVYCGFHCHPLQEGIEEIQALRDQLAKSKAETDHLADLLTDDKSAQEGLKELRDELEEATASRNKLQQDATRFAETLVDVLEAIGVFVQDDETEDEDVFKAADAYIKVRKSVRELKTAVNP